jgi:hypothetical protein
MIEPLKRRNILQLGVGLAAGLASPTATAQVQRAKGISAMDTSYTPAGKGIVTGHGRGDFDFLAGNWAIRHRKLKSGAGQEWIEFSSSATVRRVLDGIGSIEELRNPDGSFLGMGVRVWQAQDKAWADHWTSAANGVVNPPQMGRFIDGEGVFSSEEIVDGVRWIYRGVWDRIAAKSCRWHQSSSKDDGYSWSWDWWMEWTRA